MADEVTVYVDESLDEEFDGSFGPLVAGEEEEVTLYVENEITYDIDVSAGVDVSNEDVSVTAQDEEMTIPGGGIETLDIVFDIPMSIMEPIDGELFFDITYMVK